MLTAFRLCGEIDIDGGGHYGEEVDSDVGDIGADENSDFDSDAERVLRFRTQAIPIQRLQDLGDEEGAGEQRQRGEPNWELRELDTDDEANAPYEDPNLPSEEEEEEE